MKSSKEEREDYKMKRRFGQLHKLVRDLHKKTRNSQRSLDTVNQALEKVVSESTYLQQYLDAIRRAN